MKVLVTGGAGFIGSQLAAALLKAGHQVAIIDDLSTGRREYVPPEAEFFELDVSDSDGLAAAVKQVAPQVIYHLAAQKDVRISLDRPAFDARVNILGSLQLLESARAVGVQRFIFASSGGAIYDAEQPLPLTEASTPKPLSPYGVAKYTIDLYLQIFFQVHKLDFVSLRFANVYGPRQDPLGEAGVVAIFIDRMLKNESMHINGSGEQTRDFVYVDDVVAALLAAMERPVRGIYNIGTGQATSVNELWSRLAAICRYSGRPEYRPAVAGEVMRNALSFAQARQDLGWEPRTDLTAGLTKTYEWFKQQV